MISRGELKGKILRQLMKTPEYPGPYTDDKQNDAIQEAMDEIAVEMFMAGEGWTDKIAYYTTAANQVTVPIRESMTMIREVRYLYGDVYLPMTYDTQNSQPQYSDNSGAIQYASTYRIVDNQLYFNPALAEGGTDYLQIEYTDFPKCLVSDDDQIEVQFNRAFEHYIKYRAATILATTVEKFAISWSAQEKLWRKNMVDIVVKRNLQVTQIREFGD